MTMQEIEQVALALTPEDRAILADRLWQSVEAEPQTDIQDEWLEVAERRFQELKSGKVRPLEGRQILDSLLVKYS